MNTELSTAAQRIRQSIIEQSYRARVGHIGSALCIADILAVLFGGAAEFDGGEDRDRMILSKGHAALGLYAALAASGRMSEQDLTTFCMDGTPLGAHPEHVVPGIDFSTGSLGHGISLAAGAALAARMQGSRRRSFVLISDAELNEGSVWEAAMFAAHQRLGRLVVILDLNGQQALGYTRDVIDLEPVAELWRQFGWRVDELDGHDLEQLDSCLSEQHEAEAEPHLVLARTTFGKGVSYMESRIEWHYLPLSEEQYSQAMEELALQPAESAPS
ncbi:MAG: transketolase [Solirubrobacterales bacterium]